MGKRLVVVDDDAGTLEFLTTLLADYAGYAVTVCRSAADALDCIRSTQPGAIILDARLDAGQTGWDVLQQLKADPLLAPIPVIVCSGDDKALEGHAALLHRTSSVPLVKPFDIDDLLSLLEGILGP